MVNQSKTTGQFPVKTSLFDQNDRLVFLYAIDTANTSNSSAQTATIDVVHFFPCVANLIQIPVGQSDPANSSALTIQGGTMFASNNFLYIAIANNITRRVAISSF